MLIELHSISSARNGTPLYDNTLGFLDDGPSLSNLACTCTLFAPPLATLLQRRSTQEQRRAMARRSCRVNLNQPVCPGQGQLAPMELLFCHLFRSGDSVVAGHVALPLVDIAIRMLPDSDQKAYLFEIMATVFNSITNLTLRQTLMPGVVAAFTQAIHEGELEFHGSISMMCEVSEFAQPFFTPGNLTRLIEINNEQLLLKEFQVVARIANAIGEAIIEGGVEHLRDHREIQRTALAVLETLESTQIVHDDLGESEVGVAALAMTNWAGILALGSQNQDAFGIANRLLNKLADHGVVTNPDPTPYYCSFVDDWCELANNLALLFGNFPTKATVAPYRGTLRRVEFEL